MQNLTIIAVEEKMRSLVKEIRRVLINPFYRKIRYSCNSREEVKKVPKVQVS